MLFAIFAIIMMCMESIQNIVEYYDELYPVSDAQKKFFTSLTTAYPVPVKFLRLGCGSGLFEHLLAREGNDVTGIEARTELLRSANLRRRNQLMAIRFFQMSTLDMTRFLGAGFYNVIYSLNSRIVFVRDKTLMRKFFFDCRKLLTTDGTLVLQLLNFSIFKDHKMQLPTRKSVRSALFTEISSQSDGIWVLNQEVETGNGKMLPVLEDEKIYPLVPDEIKEFAKEAGFQKIELFSDYNRSPFTGKEESLIALVS
ncbi:MAG TPA: hypothetical protein DEO40_04780 [Treponema sp.]|nr:hypothetical protein [Treponema sp.]HCA19969.1 hypothetical protein [Treponema sp.]